MKLLAIASDNAEAMQLADFAKGKIKKNDSFLMLVLEKKERLTGTEEVGRTLGLATIVKQKDYLSNAERKLIEKSTIHFMRNWYRFDKGFEEAIKFEGISLGLLSEYGIRIFFAESFEQLKAVENAVKKEKPDMLLAGRNSVASKIAKTVGKKEKLPKVELVDCKIEKSYRHWPNFTFTKVRETTGNTVNISKNLFKGIGSGKKKDLVFVKSRGHYAAGIKGIKQALRNEKDLNVYSLDEFLLKRLPKSLFKFRTFRKKLIFQFKKAVKDYEASEGFAKKMQFDGIPFYELFHWRISLFTDNFWPEFAFTIQELRILFESKKPSALVLWTDLVPFEKACALIAREKKVPSLVVQHGTFEESTAENDIIGFAPLVADCIAVWGPVFKRILVKKKVLPQRIAVIGSPRTDFLQEKKFDANAFKKKINVDKKNRLVAVAYGSDQKELPKLLKIMASALHRFPNVKLVLKVHPSESKKKYENIAQGIGEKIIILGKENLYELLDSVDALITRNSTTGLEAMILKKPVIIFPKESDDFSIYKSTNAVLHASSQEGLEKALSIVFEGGKGLEKLEKNMQKFVFGYAFKQDGKATQRFVELVKKAIAKKQD